MSRLRAENVTGNVKYTRKCLWTSPNNVFRHQNVGKGGGGHFCLCPAPTTFIVGLCHSIFLDWFIFRYILESFLPGTHSGQYPQLFTITFVSVWLRSNGEVFVQLQYMVHYVKLYQISLLRLWSRHIPERFSCRHEMRIRYTVNSNGIELEQVVYKHQTSCRSGWPRRFGELKPSPYS